MYKISFPTEETILTLVLETNIVIEQEPLREVVTGVDDIVRDRWNLKCDFCKTKGRKYGACIQCGVGRCTHSFHVSCAREQQLALFDEDGDPLAIWYLFPFPYF